MIVDGEMAFSRSIHGPRMYYFIFSVVSPLASFFSTRFFCAQPEGTNQVPMATVSIYIPQAQQNRLLLTLHRASKDIQQCVLVDQKATTQSSRQDRKYCREPHYVSLFPLRCCHSLICAIKPPTTNLEFFRVPLTLSPVADVRLNVIYYFSLDYLKVWLT